MYDNIRGKISSTALEFVQWQISAPHPQKNVEVFFIAFMGLFVDTMDTKVDIGGKLEMYDYDRRWWLQVVISEETFPIESEFMHMCDLATLGGNTANPLLQELDGIGSSN